MKACRQKRGVCVTAWLSPQTLKRVGKACPAGDFDCLKARLLSFQARLEQSIIMQLQPCNSVPCGNPGKRRKVNAPSSMEKSELGSLGVDKGSGLLEPTTMKRSADEHASEVELQQPEVAIAVGERKQGP